MKKILVIQGGGRPNGNTAQLVKAFMEGAKDAGHSVELINLNQAKVNGCRGCNLLSSNMAMHVHFFPCKANTGNAGICFLIAWEDHDTSLLYPHHVQDPF